MLHMTDTWLLSSRSPDLVNKFSSIWEALGSLCPYSHMWNICSPGAKWFMPLSTSCPLASNLTYSAQFPKISPLISSQGSHKNLRKKFHDFSMTSPGQNPNFQKKIPIFVFAAHVSICRITDRHRHTFTHTDTHMIWSRPADYSTDFTSNWTDSRSQNYTC